MKAYIKILHTKRQIAEIMFRPLSVPDKYKEICIEKTIALDDVKFLREAIKSTELDIVSFINDTYFIRYSENFDVELMPLNEVKKLVEGLV